MTLNLASTATCMNTRLGYDISTKSVYLS